MHTIERLILKNFSMIFSGMKLREIDIDLSKRRNRITLLIGINGTGKTTILSNLHPFPYPGSMDNRSGSEMILDNEDGYKEIHIKKGTDMYIIKHYYMFKSTKTIKSFIAKNGVELNRNGNSMSFKEAVEVEFGIDQSSLRLLRLGAEETGFLDIAATERKTYMAKLLEDTATYGTLYKKVSEDGRNLRNLIKSLVDKITRLKIFDEDDEREILSHRKEELVELRSARDKVLTDLGSIKSNIANIIPDGKIEFGIKRSEAIRESKALIKDIASKEEALTTLVEIYSDNVEEDIKLLSLSLQGLQNSHSLNSNMIDFYINQLNGLYSQRTEKENNIKYLSSESELEEVRSHLNELKAERDRLSIFEGRSFKCTRRDLMEAATLLQTLEKHINTINQFNSDAVVSVADCFRDNVKVDHLVKREVSKIDNQLDALDRAVNGTPKPKYPVLSYIHADVGDDPCHCPFKSFYEEVTGNSVDVSTKSSERTNLEYKREFYLSHLDVARNIEYILVILQSNNALIEKMPFGYFSVKNILESIRNFTPFYEESIVTEFISTLEDYERFLDLKKLIEDANKEIQFITNNESAFNSMKKELETLVSQISEVEGDLKKLQDTVASTAISIEVEEQILDKFRIYKENSVSIDSLREKSKETDALVIELDAVAEKVKMLELDKEVLDKSIAGIDRDIQGHETAINILESRLKAFDEMNKERKILDDLFEENNILRESLSSGKGMPLLYIKLFMNNIKTTVNDLLHTVYAGDLEIDDFVINESEFRIPYFKNGVYVSDASKCSRGERSFISIAISFALLKQSVRKPDIFDAYNIMLLDEIDGSLSQVFRETFIQIVEGQLDTIDSLQTFIITHNNMFDNYPVDVIMTSNEKIENMKNANVIWSV